MPNPSNIEKLEAQLEDLDVSYDQFFADEGAERASFAARKDRLLSLLGELRSGAGDRLDAVRMGLESAWEELRATLEIEQADATGAERLSVLRMGLESAWEELRAGFQTAASASGEAAEEKRDASDEAA